jgi:RNA polymerase sigma-70 factor (ECF subfamily)
MRESVELAFVAALQNLQPNQRAVLILREVLGFSAKEVAESLDTSVASVNSALQRARKTVEERLPDQSQQATLRALGDDGLRQVVDGYVDAWQRGDVDAVVSMLAEDACFAMPPLASWFGGPEGGREEIAEFLRGYPLSGLWRWKPLLTQANGQPALAYYSWDEDEQAYMPFALNVLTLRDDKIAEVDAFIARGPESDDREVIARMPEQAFDPARLAAAFGNFGLPERLD